MIEIIVFTLLGIMAVCAGFLMFTEIILIIGEIIFNRRDK